MSGMAKKNPNMPPWNPVRMDDMTGSRLRPRANRKNTHKSDAAITKPLDMATPLGSSEAGDVGPHAAGTLAAAGSR
jgi:hypothetical protein